MLFHFLKYLQPTHYFQLYRKDSTSIFPVLNELPDVIISQLEPEPKFQSEKAREYDLSWQALQRGYIGEAPTYASFEKVSIVDEYRFLRKYFHPIWVFYVLVLRIFTFKNPFREISAWKKSGDVKRSNYLKNPIQYNYWNTFESALIRETPFVSVIIPTLNRYTYLKDVLVDFVRDRQRVVPHAQVPNRLQLGAIQNPPCRIARCIDDDGACLR